jgi:hypothetical protein
LARTGPHDESTTGEEPPARAPLVWTSGKE